MSRIPEIEYTHFVACFLCAAAGGFMCWAGVASARAADLAQLEDTAVQAAIKRVEQSVVQIQTIGGLDRAGTQLLGAGPTTGTVVSADGHIISSAYNFIQKPASILVTLPDGKRLPAKLVARDRSRMLVLLKVDASGLAVPETSPKKDMRVGQWAIAAGRSFDEKQVNVSTGIVSAVDRVWGKAIQTDAKVSPNNYGGPLVDIKGRVQGILVPLNPQQLGATAGTEWYDGGIGFAVPLKDIQLVLPRLMKGEDLYPGLLGVTLTGGRDLFGEPPTLASVRPRSPAQEAGLAKGDRITKIGGRTTDTLAQLKHALSPHYAGDTIKISVMRGADSKSFDLKLAAKLEPYEHPFLGILPVRRTGTVQTRFVYPDSPAEKAGIKVGDLILGVAGDSGNEKARDAGALRQLLAAHEPGEAVKFLIKRDGKQLTIAATLGKVPEDLPPTVPSEADEPDDKKAIGKVDITVPEFANKCFAYIPQGYSTEQPHGVVLWLHPPGGHREAELIARWQTLCERWNLILLAPRSSDPAKWVPGDAAFIMKALEQVLAKYAIDRTRVVVHGHEGGGAMAWLLALSQRDVIRAVAVTDSTIPQRIAIPDNEPLERLAVYIAFGSKSTFASRIRKNIEQLRDKKFPVTVTDQGELGRYLRARELSDLCRWIDALDRI